MENKSCDNSNRLSSRSASHSYTLDCIVNTNDLIMENEVLTKQNEQPRESSNSRRERTSKHSNDSSTNRSNHHSPISVNRKHYSSPRSGSTSSSSRQRHHHYSSQKPHRVSSPSPSPSPPASSMYRHHRVAPSAKRPHSKSRSPHERRPPIHRSRAETTKDRSTTDAHKSSSISDEKKTPKHVSSNQESTDLSFVSEDELTKPQDDTQPNSTTINDTAPSSKNTKIHSTPSLPVLQPIVNESLLDMSNVTQDAELSLFAASTLSNNNSILTPTTLPRNNFMETIDLITRYKAMQALPCNDPHVDACSKEIFRLIQKQIELQKIELSCREREIRLRERELAEREKRFSEKPSDSASTVEVTYESPVTVKPEVNEDKPQQKQDIANDQDMKDVSEEESVDKSTPSSIDASKVNLSNKNTSNQPSMMRKKTGKSRFSPSDVDPSIFELQGNPKTDYYSDDHDINLTSASMNTINSMKKTANSKILAPTDSKTSIMDTDLKVTSSNSCRKVEIQSSNMDKSSTSKGVPHDLRYTLSKNRSKHHNTDDDDGTTNGNQPINDDEPLITISKTISSKIHATKEDKNQSNDYHQQQPRSVTSTPIEAIIDDNNDKREIRRHQQPRVNNNRQQQYSGSTSSSLANSTKERSYIQDSTSQQAPKYGLNQKRHETDDLRSRLYDHKHPKSSRTTHRNNYRP